MPYLVENKLIAAMRTLKRVCLEAMQYPCSVVDWRIWRQKTKEFLRYSLCIFEELIYYLFYLLKLTAGIEAVMTDEFEALGRYVLNELGDEFKSREFSKDLPVCGVFSIPILDIFAIITSYAV